MKFEKKFYTTPKLTIHGDVEVLTQGGQNGDFTDKEFPTGTPRGQLTFSAKAPAQAPNNTKRSKS